ncbi:MAG: hypothetical protein ACRCWR_12890 [Saezia sp.]
MPFNTIPHYQATLTTFGKTYTTTVKDYSFSDTPPEERDFLTMEIDGVLIDVDDLSNDPIICNPQQYTSKQLQRFDTFIKMQKCKGSDGKSFERPLLIFQNYTFTVDIPIQVEQHIPNNTNSQLIQATLRITVAYHQGQQKLYHAYHLLGQETHHFDIDTGLEELGAKLYPHIQPHICACCKYGSWNPYGGTPFYNYLCHKKEAPANAKTLDKSQVVDMMDKKTYQRKRVIDTCADFEIAYQSPHP